MVRAVWQNIWYTSYQIVFYIFFQSEWLILGHICHRMFSSSQHAILARYLICLFEKCLIWSFIKSRDFTRVWWQIVLKAFLETVVYIFFKVINFSMVIFVIWHLVQVNSLYWEEVWSIYWKNVNYKVFESLWPWPGCCCNFLICFLYIFSKWFIDLWSYL